MNSKRKGKVGELEWVKVLITHGFTARRGQQYSGGDDSPDVICEDMPNFHAEVKRVERLNIYDAIDQARRDAGEKIPYVAHRKNRHDWLVTMRAVDFFKLVREAI